MKRRILSLTLALALLLTLCLAAAPALAVSASDFPLCYTTVNSKGVYDSYTAPEVRSYWPDFEIDGSDLFVQAISVYHWNSGLGAAPGLVGIYDWDTDVCLGEWPATGRAGNTWWDVYPNIALEGGRRYYIRTTSDETWSFNSASDYYHFVEIRGYSTGGDVPVSPDPVPPSRQTAAVENGYTEVVSCKYDNVKDFSEGLARVNTKDRWGHSKWGFIDTTGQEVIPCQYDDAWDFSEGFASVCVNDNRGNGKWGFINMAGQQIVPCKYDEVVPFHEGFAMVKQNLKWGFINSAGWEIVPCKYDDAQSFSEGFAGVCMNDKYGLQYWGFINTAGQQIVPCKYDNVYSFSELFAVVVTHDRDGDKYGYINTLGQEVVPCEYARASSFNLGLAKVMISRKGYGFIHILDLDHIPCKYEDAYGFTSDELLAKVRLNGKWGFIDMNGEEVIACQYDDALSFSEGLAGVCLYGKGWGYIDTKDKEIISCIYDRATDFSGGAAMVELNGQRGAIDMAGNNVIPFGKYTIISVFSNGIATVTSNGKVGVVDAAGREVVPCKYDKVGKFSEGLASVQLDGKWGYIKLNSSDDSTMSTAAVEVTVNGSYVGWTDAWPFIDENSRTMVPLRAVAEALGLTVGWNDAAKEASFTDGSRAIIFPIGSRTAYSGGGGRIEMDTAAVIVNSRTYAPIRYLAEFFGFAVGWDGATKTVLITGALQPGWSPAGE